MKRFNAYNPIDRRAMVAKEGYVPTTERTDIPKSKIIKLPYGMATRKGKSVGELLWRKNRGD